MTMLDIDRDRRGREMRLTVEDDPVAACRSSSGA